MEKKFKLISCINKNMVIGNKGQLLYHIGADMHFFKNTTTNNVVIMGRKTWESLPQALFNRINIIISSSLEITPADNVYIVKSIDEAIKLCNERFIDLEWYVIGGGIIYDSFLELGLISEVLFTEVEDEQDGDAKITRFNPEDWNQISKQECVTSSGTRYAFTHYVKKC